MKIARYLAHGQVSYGVVEGDSVKELSASPFESFTVTDHSRIGRWRVKPKEDYQWLTKLISRYPNVS